MDYIIWGTKHLKNNPMTKFVNNILLALSVAPVGASKTERPQGFLSQVDIMTTSQGVANRPVVDLPTCVRSVFGRGNPDCPQGYHIPNTGPYTGRIWIGSTIPCRKSTACGKLLTLSIAGLVGQGARVYRYEGKQATYIQIPEGTTVNFYDSRQEKVHQRRVTGFTRDHDRPLS